MFADVIFLPEYGRHADVTIAPPLRGHGLATQRPHPLYASATSCTGQRAVLRRPSRFCLVPAEVLSAQPGRVSAGWRVPYGRRGPSCHSSWLSTSTFDSCSQMFSFYQNTDGTPTRPSFRPVDAVDSLLNVRTRCTLPVRAVLDSELYSAAHRDSDWYLTKRSV